jgi:hypothetical protein
MTEVKWRLVRVSDFIAESLEAEADRMPLSYKEQADSLRKSASLVRQVGSKKLVRVWEDPAQTTQQRTVTR